MFCIFIKSDTNQKLMKLNLAIANTCINVYIKCCNVLSSFDSVNNFVNLVILLESQFSSALVLVFENPYKIVNKVKNYETKFNQ